MAIGPCRTCGRVVSWEDHTCPYCGANEPTDVRANRAEDRVSELLRRGVTLVVLLAILVVVITVLPSAGAVLETWKDWFSIGS